MAGKNTAVFGIYPDRTSVENAGGRTEGRQFSEFTTFPYFFPQRALARKTLLTRKTPKRLKVPRQAPEPARCWAGVWDGYSASAPSPFRAWGHS